MRPVGTYLASAFCAVLLHSFCGAAPEAAAPDAAVRIIAEGTKSKTATASAPVRTIEVHDIVSRGKRTRLLVETVPDAAAVVVLFAGGRGVLGLSAQGKFSRGTGNFLIRSRPLFLRRGVITASIDAPSDHAHDLRGFRGSAEHAADIGAVIAHLRKAFNLPIWLIGTSRGTNSVANAAVRLRENGPDGIVLSASMLAENKNGDHLFDYHLNKISLPVLIVHHRDDACWVTPAHEVPALQAALHDAQPVKALLFDGGAAKGSPCGARHYHGFNGVEETVVDGIVEWIRNPGL